MSKLKNILNSYFKEYELYANMVNYKNKSKNELFLEMINSNNEEEKENLLYGLMCKYWYLTGCLWNKWCYINISRLEEPADMIALLYDAIKNSVVTYKKHYNEATPEIIIGRCIKQEFAQKIRECNFLRNKANINTVDIDGIVEDLENEKTNNIVFDDTISFYINKNFRNFLLTILLNNDVYFSDNKIVISKVANAIKSIDNDYITTLLKYNLRYSKQEIIDNINYYQNLSTCKLRKIICDTIESYKNNKEIRDILC